MRHWHLVEQGAGKLLTIHREAPHNKNYLAPNVSRTTLRNPDLNHIGKINSVTGSSFMHFSKGKMLSIFRSSCSGYLLLRNSQKQ